jgi:valyl-tRNA synthetase
MFKPQMTTISGGYKVAAPIQSSPKDPKKKMVSSFGYASGQAKPTPDMPLAKNTSSKFDLGRNFCNKIWNAARYALGSLETASGITSFDAGSLSLADRWIIGRFNRTVTECDQALVDYRFDIYAKSLYDFFWRDLCDWYLEAIKPAMKDPARASQTARVLASLLDGSLRIMHPVIPFISETIWWKLNEVAPNRGVPGRIECPPSGRLVKALWPAPHIMADEADEIFPKVQDLITGIRQIRNDRQVNPKLVISVSINAPVDQSAWMLANREVIESLTLCTLKDVGPTVQPPANAAKLLSAGCEIFVEGLVDEAAEKLRTAKRREELEKQIAGMEGRLSNEAYIAKAPPKLVQQTKDQLAAAKAELARL